MIANRNSSPIFARYGHKIAIHVIVPRAIHQYRVTEFGSIVYSGPIVNDNVSIVYARNMLLCSNIVLKHFNENTWISISIVEKLREWCRSRDNHNTDLSN